MAHPVEIKCFPIARSGMTEGLDRWLEHLGVNDFRSPDTCAEEIIGCAAKRCYNSFEPGLNPNVTKVRSDWAKYFDNILKSRHGSVLEHVSWTWAIEGCTRVFTAEMNRHRAGVAISEGSMRYIRLDDIPYWLPQSLERDASKDGLEALEMKKSMSRSVFEEVFEYVQNRYKELCRIWGIDNLPFEEKKKLTSMFRRIVPMGVATGGVWTFNIRALRHIIELRTSPHAEEEIAYVVGMIAQHMISHETNLFGDFERQENGQWVPKNSKV